MKAPRHLKRALWIIAFLFVAGNVIRFSVVPESFGQYGDFRGAHLAEERARHPIHRGSDICGECHDERLEEKNNGAHGPVPCENCHFQPYAGDEDHPEAHPEVSQSPDRSQRACLICHQFFPSRPSAFPQVAKFSEHIATNALKLKKEHVGAHTLCVHCHNPHNPKIDLKQNG
ncbi:MAG: hypothetical protein OEZ04_08515 [Nitrospinota bacterium]|nr:hypothetical protein [Nitrospinota bacterium]